MRLDRWYSKRMKREAHERAHRLLLEKLPRVERGWNVETTYLQDLAIPAWLIRVRRLDDDREFKVMGLTFDKAVENLLTSLRTGPSIKATK